MIMFAAVSQAGLVILPNPYNHGKSESITNVEELQFSKNTMKWPTKSVLSNDDVFDIKDSWYDTIPPEDFTLTVSFKFRMKSGNFKQPSSISLMKPIIMSSFQHLQQCGCLYLSG